MKHFLFFVLCLPLAVTSGCQQGGLTIQPVTGKVTYHGEPVADAMVGFHPGDASGYTAAGITGDDGTFTLNIPGAKTTGAVAGEYRVTVAKEVVVKKGQPVRLPDGTELETRPQMKSVLPAKYGQAETSPLTATVAKGANSFILELED